MITPQTTKLHSKMNQDSTEEEGKYIVLNNYTILIDLIRIFKHEALELFTTLIENYLQKKTKEDARSAVVIFQTVIESIQFFDTNEINDIIQSLIPVFERIIKLDYDDITSYSNRLTALFKGRTDPRIVKPFIQLAIQNDSNLSKLYLFSLSKERLDVINYAMNYYHEMVNQPIEQIIDYAISFSTKLLLNNALCPNQTEEYFNKFKEIIKELPDYNEVNNESVTLSQKYKTVLKVFYPKIDQTFIIQQKHLEMIFIIFDKLLPYLQSTHSVMEDVEGVLCNYSLLFIHPNCFEEYLNHIIELMMKYSNNTHVLALLVKLASLSMYINIICMNNDRIRNIFDVTIEILQSNQPQIRLNAFDLLNSIIDIFHPINLIEERVQVLYNNATKSNSTESEQHCYILFVSAIIKSYKTDIPAFLVPILVQFASTNFRIQSCISSKKHAMLDFWESHKDLWDMYYAPLFTFEERLMLKQDNIPSYII